MTPTDKEKRDEAKRAEYLENCDVVLAEWTDHSTYGYIKMSHHLLRKGFEWATEHRIRRIYKELGIQDHKAIQRQARQVPVSVEEQDHQVCERGLGN